MGVLIWFESGLARKRPKIGDVQSNPIQQQNKQKTKTKNNFDCIGFTLGKREHEEKG